MTMCLTSTNIVVKQKQKRKLKVAHEGYKRSIFYNQFNLHTTTKMTNVETMISNVSFDGNGDDEKKAIELFQAKGEEIQKKKLQIRQKVKLQLSRADEETKRLTRIWDELEVLTDLVRKKLATVRTCS